MYKIEAFQSLIVVDDATEWLASIAPIANEILNETELLTQNDRVHHGFSMHNDSRVFPYLNFLLEKSGKFLTEQGYDISGHDLAVTSFWPQNFKDLKSYHDVHVHANSHVSGFIFLECDENTSFPVFHDPRVGKSMTQLPELDPNNKTYASKQMYLKLAPGALVMFDSFMPHSFPIKEQNKSFKFIHFTVSAIPKIYRPQ